MVNAAIQNAARKAQESLYDDTCSIIEYTAVKDEKSKLTRHEEVTVLENQPCRLSFETLNVAVQTETAANISQRLKLFLAPEIEVKGGSKIVVTTAEGRTGEYSASGIAAVYPTHQEVMLELFRGWA